MTIFILGLALFFGVHGFGAFARSARQRVIGRIGALPYKGLYSLFALAGFALIIMGWRDADATALYVTPLYLRHVTYILMLIAMILIVAAYTPSGRIAHWVKHPMLAAVRIWAFAHLLVNGEVRSVLLFGAFLAFAVADRIAVKRRNEPTPAAGPWPHDALAIVAGAGVYALIFFYLHRYIAGVDLG